MASAVEHALKLGVQMIHNGVSLAPLWSLPQISAHQAAGVTLLNTTLTSLSLSSNILHNIELGLFL